MIYPQKDFKDFYYRRFGTGVSSWSYKVNHFGIKETYFLPVLSVDKMVVVERGYIML